MTIKWAWLAGICLISTLAEAESIAISAQAGLRDPDLIAGNIRSECSALGENFSASTKKYLEEGGWTVGLSKTPEQSQGVSLKLEIANAVSAGNAFIGHSKSVSVVASLYRDGQLVDKFSTTRNSGGGAFGGFKGSCAVLYRCTNTLGSDVAKWVAKQSL